ncbi:SGNH/GDSL hydrolase family protein [Bacillus sp. REN16]|uniref:SGNH/GDSL hydrolase family protein n=1 Tax=Bacillus sp. REN16 TaxID=2887296 RepID=UPI001E524797|nr:SGNH/GDSL hydrolase family protein [Bacillus sp. REN16]MCC3356904.1 SGNH/GDSL hydrolase family protein [Bacillus sp. REN16]
MKKVLVIIVILLSVAIVVAGKLHWNNKIQATVNTVHVEKTEKADVKTVAEENQENKVQKVEAYSKNLSEEIQTKLIKAVQDGVPVNLVIAGSSATPEDPLGWPSLLKKDLEDTYGEDVLNVTIKEIADKLSTEVVQEELYQEIISLSPDILLLEPFILTDNGKVTINNRLVNLTTIIDAIKVELPEVTVLLQPANPLHNAKHYPKEVGELEKYANNNDYIYLNHWEAWPDYQTDEIKEYLLTNGSPNEKGQRLWADYLSNYFISEDAKE